LTDSIVMVMLLSLLLLLLFKVMFLLTRITNRNGTTVDSTLYRSVNCDWFLVDCGLNHGSVVAVAIGNGTFFARCFSPLCARWFQKCQMHSTIAQLQV